MIRLALAGLLCIAANAARAGDDPNAIAREMSQRFVTACENADVPAALALYADDASVVYPAEGARAEGKEELARLLDRTCLKRATPSRFVHGRARFVGDSRTEIAASAEWESTATGPEGKPAHSVVRTTEVLVKTPAGWRYLIDHASIGIPLPAPAPEPAR